MTHVPIGTISPVSSATRMKVSGMTTGPSPGTIRSSASAPQTAAEPSRIRIFGCRNSRNSSPAMAFLSRASTSRKISFRCWISREKNENLPLPDSFE